MKRWICLLLNLLSPLALFAAEPTVELLKTPNDGLQPQVALDGNTIHLAYFKGDPTKGDVFYVHGSSKGADFSAPIRVNSREGSVLAMGTMRGHQMAVGKNGRVHVAWMGSRNSVIKGRETAPMMYARLNDSGSGFEPERNVLTWAGGLDGGGTIAADLTGSVYVAWHGRGEKEGEENRAVYLARSRDDGKVFERERRAGAIRTGACACCGMRAGVDQSGALHILFRNATNTSQRDMTLLSSTDGGETFQATAVSAWSVKSCPASTAFLAQVSKGALAAWESERQVQFGWYGSSARQFDIHGPSGAGKRKYPTVAQNSEGTILMTWIEDSNWGKGGTVSWQLFDKSGTPSGDPNRGPATKPWTFATAMAKPDGSFAILY